MAAERLAPDTLAAQTGNTGAVTDIDDDPDAPDANWLVATGNNVSTDARVTFGTPSAAPTVGAGLQEFRAQVRQFGTGQSGTPTARIELWENGSLVRAGSDVNVTGAGQVMAFTWNANELATADGSLVECKIVGTKSGGSPSARNTVDIGAVEWNADVVGSTFEEAIALAGQFDLTNVPDMAFGPALGFSADIGLAPDTDMVFEPALGLAASLDAATAAEAVIDRAISLAATFDASQAGGLALNESLTWAASLGDGYGGALTIIEALSFPASLTATLARTLDLDGAASYGTILTLTGADELVPGGPEIFEDAVSFLLTLDAPLAGVIPTGAIPRNAATSATARGGATPATARSSASAGVARTGGTVTTEGGSTGDATGRGPGTPAAAR